MILVIFQRIDNDRIRPTAWFMGGGAVRKTARELARLRTTASENRFFAAVLGVTTTFETPEAIERHFAEIGG